MHTCKLVMLEYLHWMHLKIQFTMLTMLVISPPSFKHSTLTIPSNWKLEAFWIVSHLCHYWCMLTIPWTAWIICTPTSLWAGHLSFKNQVHFECMPCFCACTAINQWHSSCIQNWLDWTTLFWVWEYINICNPIWNISWAHILGSQASKTGKAGILF